MEYTDASYSHRGCFLYYELYIDQFFAEQLLIGSLLLLLTAKRFGRKIEWTKLFLASIENAAVVTCAAAGSVTGSGRRLEQLIAGCLYLAGAAVAVRIAFGKASRHLLGKWLLGWLGLTVWWVGVWEAAVRCLHTSASTGAVLSALLIFCLLKVREKREFGKAQTAEVTVFWKGKKQKLKGMIDTGNLLKEPLTGQPVSIVEKSAILPLLGENWQEYRGFYLIPYHSIGTEKGWLQGIRADRMEIQTSRVTICVEQPVLAIYEGTLSAQKSYQIILHPWHADEKEEK